MFAEERRQRILSLLDQQGRITVGELTALFDVSADTIRRDLQALEQKGYLQRTHGGALNMQISCQDERLTTTEAQQWKAKESICQAAVKLICPGETIFIEGGSTTLCMAKFMPRQQRLTIVTNGWGIAEQLKGQKGIELLVVGGVMKATGNTTGTGAIANVGQYTFDLAFISATGVDRSAGITASTSDAAFFKQAVASIARKVVLLADGGKLGRVAFAKSITLADIDILITDGQLSEDFVRHLDGIGVDLMVT